MRKIIFIGIMLMSVQMNLSAQTSVAHWKFTPEHTSGTIRDGDLVITDLTSNGNDLYFHPVSKNTDGSAVRIETLDETQKNHLEQQFTWVDDVLGSDNTKSLLFNTGARNWEDIGGYFETAETAALNQTYFEGGYTIEVIFKLPHNFTSDEHRWTSIFSREGSAQQYIEANPSFGYGLTSGEKELLHGLTISSLQELQWFYWMSRPYSASWANVRQQTSWSFSLADLEDWYHVTLINDGTGTEVYVNGVTDFRNASNNSIDPSASMMPSLDGYGWLVGATGYYESDSDGDGIGEFPITKLFDGTIQEMRFTVGALPQEDWLYADEESETKTELGTNEDIALLTDDNNYNIVFVPDTQKPTRYMSEIVDIQMQWIADHDEEHNIVFTNFLGDLVDRYNQQTEWDNILNSLQILKDGDVRFMTVDGNHDGYNGASSTDAKLSYIKFFNPSYYQGASYYGNQSTSGYAAYSIIRGGNYTYLFITVSHYITNYLADIDWVNGILAEYSYLPVIFSTHEHLGFEEDGSGTYRVDDRHAEDAGVEPEDLYNTYKFAWQRVLKSNNNVFMAMSGHNHGAGYQISANDFGNNVFEGVYDYQSDYHGGNGWMNFLEFDEDDNKISFKVFSPWVDQIPEEERTYYDVRYRTGAKEYFDYQINFSERFSFYPQLSLESQNEGEIILNSENLEDLTNVFVAVYPVGQDMIFANEVTRTTMDVTGQFNLSITEEGSFVAVVRKTGVYVPISNEMHIDLMKPTVEITRDVSTVLTNDNSIAIAVTFSEEVQGLEASDIIITNGVLSNLATDDNMVFTFILTPVSDGIITIDVASGVVTDLSGNANTAAVQFSSVVDLVPTVVITSTETSPTSSASFEVDIMFSEEVQGLEASDIIITNGMLSDLVTNDDMMFTFILTPVSDGIITVDMASGAVTDLSGNANIAAGQFSLVVDQTGPSTSITGVPDAVKDSFTSTVLFTEVVTGFTIDDINTANANVSAFVVIDELTYTLLISPVGGEFTVSIAADVAFDEAGNGNQATEVSGKFDRDPHVVENLEDVVEQEGFETLSIDLTDIFVDADGDALVLSALSNNESVAIVEVKESTLIITEVGVGETTIVVTASDESNGVEESFMVTIFANNILGVNENNQGVEGLNLYPNPVTDFINLEAPEESEISIYNMSGERLDIKVIKEDKRYKLDLSLLKPAIYLIKVIYKGNVEVVPVIRRD